MQSFDLLAHALGGSLFSLVVLFVLLFMSVLSWGVGIAKFRSLILIKIGNRRTKASLLPLSADRIKSALPHGKAEFSKKILKTLVNDYGKLVEEVQQGTRKLERRDVIDALERRLVAVNSESLSGMEAGLGLLASISNTAPFIGLLGTVTGITISFQEIGLQGNANLAVVAPGISEALFATAFGLFAAIPASLFYNFSKSRIRQISEEQFNLGRNLITYLVYKTR